MALVGMVDHRDLGGLIEDIQAEGQAYAQDWINKFNRQGQALYALRAELERMVPGYQKSYGANHPTVVAMKRRIADLAADQAETRKFRDWVYEFGYAYLGWDAETGDLGALPALVIGGVAVSGAAYLARAYTQLDERRAQHEQQVGLSREVFQRIASAPANERAQLLKAAEKALNSSASFAGQGFPWGKAALGLALIGGGVLAYRKRDRIKALFRPRGGR